MNETEYDSSSFSTIPNCYGRPCSRKRARNFAPVGRSQFFLKSLAISLLLLSGPGNAQEYPSTVETLATTSSQLIRPVAVEFLSDSETLVVASQDGSVTSVSVKAKKKLERRKVGKSLRSICPMGDDTFVFPDFESHRIVAMKFEHGTGESTVLWQSKVAHYPNNVVFDSSERKLFVSSLWSQRLSVVDVSAKVPNVVQMVDLPFAPGVMAWDLKRKTLFVAGAFTNRIVSISKDADDTWRIDVDCSLEGTSIRSMAISPDGDQLLIGCQILNQLAHTSRNDIHWGLLMSNEIRQFDIPQMLGKAATSPQIKKIAPTRTDTLGRDENGKADPGDFVFLEPQTAERSSKNESSKNKLPKNKPLVIAIEATNEIAYRGLDESGKPGKFQFRQVGRHPVDLCVSPDCRWIATANRLDDSVSIIDTTKLTAEVDASDIGIESIDLGAGLKLTDADKGEVHFFSGDSSHDRWISCNSCHVQAHTNGLLNDNSSDQSFGTPKSVISTMGRNRTAPFAWNGSSKTMEDQIEKSILNTMQLGRDAETDTVQQIAEFLKSLEPPPALLVAREQNSLPRFAESIASGKRMFRSFNCQQCHNGKLYVSPDNANVGLVDERGESEFNPPSLAGVSQRARFFHDGRAKSLNELVEKYEHQLPRKLTKDEIADLVNFLKSI